MLGAIFRTLSGLIECCLIRPGACLDADIASFLPVLRGNVGVSWFILSLNSFCLLSCYI
jgi:hypothetical protein